MKLRQIVGIGLAAVALGGLAVLVQRGQHAVDQNAAGQPVAVATFYGLYDPLRAVAANDMQVENVTPAGAEPHDYEPTPKQLADLSRSRLLVYNGGVFEPWTPAFLADYRQTAVKGSQSLQLTAQDPHYWLDPVLMQQVVLNIRDGLVTADPTHAPAYRQRAAAYITKLKTLDSEYRAGLAQCRQRTVVVSHEALGYVARRYGFEAAAIAGLDPEAEPDAGKIAELAQLVKSRQIRYIFFETLVSPRIAQTLADETGAATLVFDPLEGLSEAEQAAGKDYFSVQRQNLANLRQALDCQ